MSPTDASPRPSQVTVAGWAIAIASVMLVIAVFDTMGSLHTVDMREQVTRTLASGSFKDLGISLDDALTFMRWGLFVSGAAAAATAILGIFVLQRNHGARIGLSIAAVPIVLTSPVSDSFLGMLIVAGTAILWTRPARDWFAGRPPAPRPEPAAAQSAAPSMQAPPAPPVQPWIPPTGDQPPPMAGWGQAPQAPQAPGAEQGQAPAPYAYPAPVGAPVAYPQPTPYAGQVAARPRPRQVKIACILTWIFSGVTAIGYLILLGVIAADPDALLDVVKESPSWDQSFDDELLTTTAVVVSAVFLIWCLAAAVLAALAWRGTSWAWIALTISAGVAALVSLLAFPYSLPHVVAIAVSLGMLMSRPARDWFAGRR